MTEALCIRCGQTFDDLPDAHKYGLCLGCDDPDDAYNRQKLEPQGGPPVVGWWYATRERPPAH